VRSPLIDATDGSLLPTPRASDGPKGGPNQTGDSLQPTLKALLPTPTARLGDERGAQAARYVNPERSNDLDDAVLWISDRSHLQSVAGSASSAGQRPRQPRLFEDG
jgi:hypothetical protein